VIEELALKDVKVYGKAGRPMKGTGKMKARKTTHKPSKK
jgi:hypothetical protein